MNNFKPETKGNSIYHFVSGRLPQLEEVGGKALSLITLTQQGFPVPPGFVLATGFFQPWIDNIKESSEWQQFLKSQVPDLKNVCDAVKLRAGSLRFTTGQNSRLRQALQEVREEENELILAVRSSSPEEDLEGASFAGGYKTTLGVTEDKLEKAIRDSFISVFDERVVKYKIHQGLRTDDPKIAIIVQRQLDSDMSGVGFSLNPQNNCYDEAVINANFGLGETVVAGQVTPDSFVVEKVKKEILEKKVANKSHALWLKQSGLTEEKLNIKPAKSSLSDKQVLAVTALVTQVEERCGKPMDIEWTYTRNKLYLLQARPITAYLPLPEELVTPPGEVKILFSDPLLNGQGIDKPLSVLGTDVFYEIAKVSNRNIFRKDVFDIRDGLFYISEGRMYIQLSNMKKIFGLKLTAFIGGSGDQTAKKIIESIDFEEYTPQTSSERLRWLTLSKLIIGLKLGLPALLAYLQPRKALRDYQKNTAVSLQKIRRLEALPDMFSPASTAVLEWIAAFSGIFLSIIFPPLIARWRMAGIFKKDNVKDLMVNLEMALPGNPTSEMGQKMYELASYKEVQECSDRREFVKRLTERSFSKEFLAAWDAYMEQFGFRAIRELDIATPRPYENPEVFFDQLKNLSITKGGKENIFQASERRQQEAYEKLLQLAVKKGKLKAFEKYASIIRSMAGYRESPKYYIIMVIDFLRRRALRLADTWITQGRLNSRNQIFMLTLADIEQGEKDPHKDLLAAIEKNTAYWVKVKDRTDWPQVFDSRGKFFRLPAVANTTGILVGEPIAPGIVSGKVKVLHHPYEKPLEPGEILVTRVADPCWTPLFINAAGVVLEIGSALQHGAIIAREYGLPCVSGIEGATKILKDGQIVEVNGSDGTVKEIVEIEDK